MPARVNRNQQVKQRLFPAAVQILGGRGYKETSIAKITDLAGVGQDEVEFSAPESFRRHIANAKLLARGPFAVLKGDPK
jgi:hypothetical protein